MAIRLSPMTFVRWLIDAAIVGLVVAVLVGVGLIRLLPLTGHETRIIAGPSMEPSLPLGSLVILDRVTGSDILPGDIVTIRIANGAAPYTHRVTRLLTIDGVPYLETKGDANAAPDPTTVPASTVSGRVAVGLPLLGYLLALLTMPSGVLAILGLGFSLVLLALLLDPPEGSRVASPGRARPAPTLDERLRRHLATTPRRARRAGLRLR